MLTKQFRKAHDENLIDHFSSFYDDINEYGNPNSKNCIYFIHGINGAPGQIRFALPAASRYFQNDIYVKGLLTPEFSSQKPVWEKYTLPNLDKRIAAIVADITALAQRYNKVMVFCSSNGFYDFYAAASRMDATTRARITLFWVAVAPDRFEDTLWEKIFFRINGIVHGNYHWCALPNSNALRWLNPEVPYRHRCRARMPHKYFYKHDMESRFFLYGALWAYFSIPCFNDCLAYLTKQGSGKLTMPAYVLAAEKDGYWQGKTVEDMQKIIERYIEKPMILTRPTSHLWVAAPEHVYALLQKAFGEHPQKAACDGLSNRKNG